MKRILVLLSAVFIATAYAQTPTYTPEISVTQTGTTLRIYSEDRATTEKMVKGKKEMKYRNKKHLIYTKGNLIAHDIEYSVKPPKTEVFRVDSPANLEWTYQGELTAEQKEKGWIRPDNVIGSYAIYDTVTDKKFGHLYRPKLIDANGDVAWGEMHYESGSLTVTMPSKWLDNAAYPITLDPDFGKTTVGATLGSGDNKYAIGPYSPASNGTLTSMSLQYTKHPSLPFAATNFKTALYSDSAGAPSAKLAESNEGTTVQATWVTVTMTTSPSISSSTSYWLVVINQTPGNVYYYTDTVSGKTRKYRNDGIYVFEDPFVSDGSDSNIIPLYATYTESSGVIPTKTIYVE